MCISTHHDNLINLSYYFTFITVKIMFYIATESTCTVLLYSISLKTCFNETQFDQPYQCIMIYFCTDIHLCHSGVR